MDTAATNGFAVHAARIFHVCFSMNFHAKVAGKHGKGKVKENVFPSRVFLSCDFSFRSKTHKKNSQEENTFCFTARFSVVCCERKTLRKVAGKQRSESKTFPFLPCYFCFLSNSFASCDFSQDNLAGKQMYAVGFCFLLFLFFSFPP